MRLGIPYDNEYINQHFGHSRYFKIYKIENDSILGEKLVPMDIQGHSAIIAVLVQEKVDIVLCGNIGDCAQKALRFRGIRLIAGNEGKCDEVVVKYLNHTLQSKTIDCTHNCKCEE